MTRAWWADRIDDLAALVVSIFLIPAAICSAPFWIASAKVRGKVER